MKTKSTTLAAGLILVASISQFIPHPPNFSPMAAIALFGGAKLGDKRLALVVTLASLLVCDLVQGLHQLIPFVYASYALSVWLGFGLRNKCSPRRVAGTSILGSTLFFLITNFGVWALLGSYPPTLYGLIECYVAALPYFQNTVLSGLCYSAVLFGGVAWASLLKQRADLHAASQPAE